MSKSRAKGTAFETDVVNFLHEFFPGIARHAMHGALDVGDINGVPDVTIECKNVKVMDLASWMNEAALETKNAGTRYGVVVHKRRSKGVAQAYVTMTLDEWAHLYAHLQEVRGAT